MCTSGSVQTLFKTPHWEAPDPCFRPCFRNHRRDIVHTWSRHSSRAQRHVPRRDVADRVVYPDYTLYYADTLLRRRIVSALAGRRGIEFDIRPLFHGQGAIDEFSLSGGQPVDDSCSSLKTSFCQGRGRRQTKSQEPPIRQITIHSLEFSFAAFLSDWGEHRQIVGGRVSAPSQRRPNIAAHCLLPDPGLDHQPCLGQTPLLSLSCKLPAQRCARACSTLHAFKQLMPWSSDVSIERSRLDI